MLGDGETEGEEVKNADLIIIEQHNGWAEGGFPDLFDGKNILVVQSPLACRQDTDQYQLRAGGIRTPIGPFKLARYILAVLDQEPWPTASAPDNTSPRLRPMRSSLASKGLPMHGEHFPDPGLTLPFKIPTPEISPNHDETVQKLTPAPPTDVQSSSSLKQKTSGLQILAVDDNILNLRLLQRFLLKRKTDTVWTARDGLEAVTSVQEAAHKGIHFDVIFMDISMPKMGGFEATRLIRSFERSFAHRSTAEDGVLMNTNSGEDTLNKDSVEIREQGDSAKMGVHRAYVVALTGLASQRDRDEAEACGFNNFLTKPLSFEKIVDLLEQLSTEKARMLRRENV